MDVKNRIQFRKYRKWYYTVCVSLAAIIVFCTVYALILPAITMGTRAGIGGYNPDGSIWWAIASFNQTTADTIRENTPYIIAGYNRKNVLTAEAESETMLKTARPETTELFRDYEIWQFEGTESADGYLIYTIPSDGGERRYLCLNGSSLTLTAKENATPFTLANEGDDNRVTLKAGGDYLNTYGADTANCSGWAGYNILDDGSRLQILNVPQSTAQKMVPSNSPNSVINLFDYWITGRDDADNVPINTDELQNGGINKNHAFKFSRGSADEFAEKLNHWVGKGENPLQGIVSNQLDKSGYPVLSGSHGSDSTESLAYLFNPSVAQEGKASYRNVIGLLDIDPDGYYAFDSAKRVAEFDRASNSFNVYDQPCSIKGFYPFNKAPEIMTSQRDDPVMNHYFGMTITTRFRQLNGGHTTEERKTATTFEFSGDDDVWIFIDGVLVGDLGGIHDASSVSINFATGEVSVCVNGGNRPLETTLYERYEAAGKVDAVKWITNGAGQQIFADNTSHTLKFFYLERGNYNSNLRLKYNLTEIPVTGIQKVDQYGDPIPGATFAAYAADENYNMLSGKNGERVTVPENPVYDESGNILDADGQIAANAIYTGTTGVDGMMIFVDPDDQPYTIDELENLFGKHFILREIKIPDGYRIVYKDIHLQIWVGSGQKIIRCDNTPQSGVRANSNLQVMATDYLHLRREYNGGKIVQYQNPDDETTFGTLFAVVFKKTGENTWTPVYGSNESGYTLVPVGKETVTGPTAGLKAALEAAKESAKMNGISSVVFHRSSEGHMQLTIENLPGHITTYYYMLDNARKDTAEYTVAYYWTDQDSLEKAVPENTYRVYTFAEATEDGESFSNFTRSFGATIQVPNLINRILVQKMDEDGERINGATFAIYQVEEQPNGVIRYLAQNGDYVALPEGTAPDSSGVITVGDQQIVPLSTDITRNYDDGVHTGTAGFTDLSSGQYIIKEVNAPPGYKLNTADVMVLITEDAIYANAGTEDDGVTVGRGPGYLVAPLNQFASLGDIDNTLTWVYARMLISEVSTSFADAQDSTKILGYLKKNNSYEYTENKDEAFKAYLIYEAGNIGTVFDYVPNPGRNQGLDSDGFRRLFTTAGWSHYAILQDYEYGLEQVAKSGAYYEDWSTEEIVNEKGEKETIDRNLMNLFSRSTYIRVTNVQNTTVTVKKVDSVTPALGLGGAQFRLYRTETVDGAEIKRYYSFDAVSNTHTWTDSPDSALVVTTIGEGENKGLSDNSFTGLKDGVYYLEEVKPPDGYKKLSAPVKLELKYAVLSLTDAPANSSLDSTLDSDNFYTYTITVPNLSGYELPSTGGSGVTLYTMGGLLLMALPLVYGCKKKRGSERRHKAPPHNSRLTS